METLFFGAPTCLGLELTDSVLDLGLLKTFIITYKSYATPDIILIKLKQLFSGLYSADPSQDEIATRQAIQGTRTASPPPTISGTNLIFFGLAPSYLPIFTSIV